VKITATVRNTGNAHDVCVCTAGNTRELAIPAKSTGGGSAVNGGELLMLALATCYCNDIYREALRLAIAVQEVEVEACADFDGVGLAARNVTYRARVRSDASPERLEQLLRETDAVAEVHNTVRAPIAVTLMPWDA
jgi:organic hydroperoxide reductase OsmC/OhrA